MNKNLKKKIQPASKNTKKVLLHEAGNNKIQI